MIRKFSTTCYGRKSNVIDKIKMHNKTSVWHELLSYLLSPNSVLKVYKVECNHSENNKCVPPIDLHTNVVVRPYVLFYNT